MEAIQYLRAIRGRWIVVVAVVAIGLLAAWLTRDVGAAPKREEARREYVASSVLLSSTSARAPGFSNLETLSAVARLDHFLARVARRIGYAGEPDRLKSEVEVVNDPSTGFLTFTARSPDPAEAERLANGFGKTMIRFVFDKQLKELDKQTEAVEEKLGDVRGEISRLTAKLEVASEEDAQGIRDALRSEEREEKTLDNELQQLNSSIDELGRIELIQPAVAKPGAAGGPAIPGSTGVRLGIGAALGLLLGVLLALLLERVNTRIRNSEAAERHFQVPVLARIPRIPLRQRKSSPVAVVGAPSSSAADAFRVLAASMMQWPPLSTELAAEAEAFRRSEGSRRTTKSSKGTTQTATRPATIKLDSPRPERAILITSAGADEGKSTIVANLAGAFSELGKKTVVLSCDLREPEVHTLLGVANEPGLVDGLTNTDRPVLNGRLLQSPLNKRISVVPSGEAPENPAELLNSDRMRTAIDEACRKADVVLIDTPPLLAAMDVASMISEVDAVLVVARSGKTTTRIADATSETLNTLAAPFLGVVLNDSSDVVRPRAYGGFPPLSRQQRDS